MSPRESAYVLSAVMTETPHDHLVRAIFGQTVRAAAELHAVLPERVRARLDLATLTRVPDTFIDANLRDRRADLLFTVSSRAEGHGPVYVLLEHQSCTVAGSAPSCC